jgi:hypothetical protein
MENKRCVKRSHIFYSAPKPFMWPLRVHYHKKNYFYGFQGLLHLAKVLPSVTLDK